MQYKKLTSKNTVIEFHNNWLGEETVIVGGQVVSKKSSIWGAHHYFNVMENGKEVRYILTTKVGSNLQVLLDLRRNGEIVHEDVLVSFGSKPKIPENKAKKQGFIKLKEYDVKPALIEFEKALDLEPNDPEIYFHMACAYSNLEKTNEAFASLKKAVENGLQNHELILNHDMLAFIRMHDAFESFLNSGFSEYDIKEERKKDS